MEAIRTNSRGSTLQRERGFTLIEMMVVVAIIAILVTLLVPNFMRARAQAQTAACEANMKEIATGLEMYYADNLNYPSGATAGSSNPVDAADPLVKYYLKQAPVDPAAGPGKYYTYSISGSGTGDASYTILCPGLHAPLTLQTLNGGTAPSSDSSIQYDSNSGFSVH